MIIAAIVVSVLFPFVTTWAATGSEIALSPTPAHPNASGTAFIDGSHVNIQARGLKSEAVYTVWFVNMKPGPAARLSCSRRTPGATPTIAAS